MEKSFVAVEQRRCPICGKDEDAGVLIHKRLSRVFEGPSVVTGWDLCKEHQQRADEGYIALIEVAGENANITGITLEQSLPLRTGNLAHIRRHLFEAAFNSPAPPGPMCFVQVGVIEKLRQAMEGT